MSPVLNERISRSAFCLFMGGATALLFLGILSFIMISCDPLSGKMCTKDTWNSVIRDSALIGAFFSVVAAMMIYFLYWKNFRNTVFSKKSFVIVKYKIDREVMIETTLAKFLTNEIEEDKYELSFLEGSSSKLPKKYFLDISKKGVIIITWKKFILSDVNFNYDAHFLGRELVNLLDEKDKNPSFYS